MNNFSIRKISLLYFIVLIGQFGFSQNFSKSDQHIVDSLQFVLKKKNNHDTSIVQAYIDLSHYLGDLNSNTGIDYCSKALKIIKKAYDKKPSDNVKRRLEELEYFAYRNTGVFYNRLNNAPLCLKYSFKSYSSALRLKDNEKIGRALFDIGNINFSKGDYSTSIIYFFKALEVHEKSGNKLEVARTYIQMSDAYARIDDFSNCEKYGLKGLNILKKLNPKKEQKAVKSTYLGVLYTNLGDNLYCEQGKYDKALQFQFKALEYWNEVGDSDGLVWANCRIGRVYSLQGKFDLAFVYFNKVLKAYSSGVAVDKRTEAFALGHIGIAYTKMGEFQKAKSILHRGVWLADSLKNTDLQIRNHLALYEVYNALGEKNEALEQYRKYHEAYEIKYSPYRLKTAANSEMDYTIQKKSAIEKMDQEKKDALAKKEIERQKLVRNSFVGGFALMLLFSAIFLRQRNKIRKGNIDLVDAKNKAEKSEQFKQDFLANMSHEIRTPMNAVMGMTNLVLDSPLQEKQKFYLDRIKKSGDTLLHIINDILDLSKIEAGKMELEKIDFSISDTIDQVKQTLSHRADEKGLELITIIDPTIHDVVLGDPVRLNQVLINLAGNAIKFTEQGSVCIDVSKSSESAIKFSIIDTGIGIPKDKLESVFENFSQANTSDTRKYGGTGLGLSISRQLVEMMGGKISIESEEGSGTTFSFTVEFAKGSEESLDQRLAAEQNIDGSILDELRILVVDDNEYNRIVAKDTLESKSKAKVAVAESGFEAIELLKQEEFDVVLMDIQMPGMNGFEATRHIRSNFESPVKEIPIIALTASVLRTDLDKCKDAGMDSYIPKPFKASQLIIGIAQTLNITLKSEKKIEKPQEKVKKETKPTKTSGITDMSYLRKFCEEDEVRMTKYIGMFTSTAPALIDKLKAGLETNDLEEIANQVHAFKTKWIMMGMTETKDLAIRIEMQCREQQDGEQLRGNINELIANVEKAVEELT